MEEVSRLDEPRCIDTCATTKPFRLAHRTTRTTVTPVAPTSGANRPSPTSAPAGARTNTAAVNAAQADLTAARQRASTAQDGIDTLESATDSLKADATAAQSGLDRAKTAHETVQSELEASNAAVTTAQTEVDSAQTELDTATDAVTTAQAELDAAQESVTTTQAELDAATEKVKAAEATVETATEKVETAQTKVETATEAVETAQTKVETATEAVETAQERVDTATEAVETAQARVDEAQTRVDTAQQAVEAAQTRVDTAQTRVDTAQTRVDTAQTRVDTAQTAVDAAQTRVDAAQTRFDTATTAVETAQGELDAANEAVTAAEAGVQAADAELTAATEAVTAAQADVTAADANVTAKQGELTAATAAVGAAQGRVDGARGAVSSAEGAVSAAERNLRNAEARLRANPDDPAAKAAVRNARAQLNNARAQLTNARNELRNAEAALREARAAEQRARDALAQAEREAAEARRRLAEAEERKRQAEAAKAEAEEALRQAQAAQQAAQQALDTAQAELVAAQTELTEATTALETAQTELETAQTELETAQTELEEAQTELEEAQAELEEAQAELETAQTELEEAQTELEEAQTELEEAQAELETAQAELKTAEAELETAEAELETAEAELEAAETELETAETELEAAETELETAETALEAAETVLEEAETALEEAEATAEEAQSALNEAKSALDEAKAEQTDLQGAVNEAQAEVDAKQQEFDRLEQQADEKTAQLAEARSRLTAAQSEVDAAQAALDQARSAPADAPQPEIEGDADGNGVLSQAERDALADAAHLDGALTPAEIAALQEQQAELLAAEQEAQERYGGIDGAVTDSTSAGEQASINNELEAQAAREIADERRRYYQENPYYVDANGEVFAASVDASGNLVLKRNSSQPKSDEAPQVDTARTTTIETSRNRTDVAVHTSVPRTPEEPVQTRTETVRTDPTGEQTSAQIRLEQELEHPDGSVNRSITQEDYDARGIATERLQEQSYTAANGDGTLDRAVTSFGPDGTTPTRMVIDAEQRVGEQTSARTTETNYDDDGLTTRQVVEESGTDAEGTELPSTRAETDYDEGEPATTYITRNGGELPEGVTRSEYVVWGPGGRPDQRVKGGADTTKSNFESFIEDGTTPPTLSLPDEPQQPSFYEWKAQREADGHRVGGHGAQHQYDEFVEEWQSSVHAEWQADVERINAVNDENALRDVDPEAIHGSEDPVRWVRNDNNVFEGEALGGNLVEPLQPARDTPSVFDVPAALQARAAADALDRSPAATNPEAFAALDQTQQEFETDLAAATTDAARERIMREYFADNDYWIDRGSQPGDEPVLMASGWSNGSPASEMFGSDRAAEPHAQLARTGILGVDDLGQDATIDVLANLYVDGSRDDIVRTSYAGPGGAERTVVTGEHTNADDVVTERDRNAQTMVARTEQGLSPLAVTEISRERFNPATGLPQGEQFFAVAQSDATMTSLEERRDIYGADGLLDDTKIDSTQMSRNFDEDITDDFLAANAAVIAGARDDDFNPNEDGTTVTVPPAGSYFTHSSTDIDYDDEGVAIYQVVEDESITVADAGDDNHNGVVVTQTNSTREAGTRAGFSPTGSPIPASTTPIFDDQGNLAVDERITTDISTSEYDPDAGTAGGNRGLGHQFREITSISLSQTRGADGTIKSQSATPYTIQTLREGFDDDWIFTENQFATDPDGQVQTEGEGDDERPIEVEGTSIHREDLDFADKFEEFMEGWGGRIVGGLAIVAGIAGAVFTGGASLALTAVGVGLASTSLAYTALNYRQGEASGWDLALAGAGVALVGLPAITGVKQLVGASRGARAFNVARASGAADDVARGIADDVLRASTQTSRATANTLRVGNTADNVLDANDGVDATRAALQGDFWGAGMMLFAIGGGAAAGRVRARVGNVPPMTPSPTPDLNTSGANGAPAAPGTPGTPGTPSLSGPESPTAGGVDPLRPSGPATSQDAPSVNSPTPAPAPTAQPLPGTSTGSPAPTATPTTPAPTVAGASGEGDAAIVPPAGDGSVSTANAGASALTPPPAAGPITPSEIDGSIYERLLAENGWDNFTRIDGSSPDIAMQVDAPLTEAQLRAVRFQTGLPHERINPAIRAGETSGAVWGADYELATHIERTDAAINGSTFAEPGTVFRGVRMDDAAFQQLLTTGRFGDAAYMSTTRKPGVAFAFPSQAFDPTTRQVVFSIETEAGQRGLDVGSISNETHEMEILLPRNSELEVIDVRINADGDAIVRTRLIDSPTTPAATSQSLQGMSIAPTSTNPANVESIFTNGIDVGGDRVPVRNAEPGSTHYSRDENGAISEYGVIGADGVPDMIVYRAGDGWKVITPTVNANGSRFLNPAAARRDATNPPRDAAAHEIPVATTPAGAAGLQVAPLTNSTIYTEQFDHVVRTHTAAGRQAAADAGITTSTYRSSRLDAEVNERYFNEDGTAKSVFDASVTPADLDVMIRDAVANGTWVRQGDGTFMASLDTDGPIGVTGGLNPRPTNRIDVVLDADGNLVTAYPSSGRADGLDGGDTPTVAFATATGAARDSANAGRPASTQGRAPLEPPIPVDRDVRGGVTIRGAEANAAITPLLGGTLQLPGERHPFNVRGLDANGRIVVDQSLTRGFNLEESIRLNPVVVARLGGADAVRTNPQLLNGLSLNVVRSDGSIQAGWTISTEGGRVTGMSRSESRALDVGEFLVRRQQADPSFDGRAALRDVIAANPTILTNRPLRLRRSEVSIAEGRAAHNIDDGWYATDSTIGTNGETLLTLSKNYRFELLSEQARARYAAQGYGPGSIVPLRRHGIPLDEVLDFNRARLEGDHGQIPNLQVRYQTPDGHLMGTNRDLQPSAISPRADQAVVHTQAALDYLYSRYGYVPTGGDITLVIDATGAHNNASMQSLGNVLRIGTHDTNGAAFDPSVIMHELGHKMVDDHTASIYGRTQGGAIHEGIADVQAAAWTHDAIIGRVFEANGIRDLRTGRDLIGTRQQWDAISQAQNGAGAHAGSGVITGFASRLVPPPLVPGQLPAPARPGTLSWSETGDLFTAAMRTGGMRSQMDFDSFSDSLRIATAQRYGLSSPQYARVQESLMQAGIDARPAPGAQVSRITSRGTVEHGYVMLGYDARGYAMLRDASGRELLQSPSQLITGGGRYVQTDASGRIIDVVARPAHMGAGNATVTEPETMTTSTVGGGPVATTAAANPWNAVASTGTGNGASTASRPSIIRRLASHLVPTPAAAAASNSMMHARAVIDREREASERRQAELDAQQQLALDHQDRLGG
jgi:chromosome segregation ATPase